MQEFFDSLREACSARIWSRGVELARSEAVSVDGTDEGEIHLRVATRGGLISPNVTLYLDDEDWECSCNGADDPCEHIAAAAIAVRQAQRSGHTLPEPSSAPGRLRYAFTRCDGGLALEREIVRGDEVVRLATTLEAIASGRVDGPPFAADQRDLRIEVGLGSRRSGPMPRGAMTRLVDDLAGSDQVRLDGQPVKASSERVVPHGRLVDAPGGFRIFVEPDPSITEVFSNGCVLCGDTLRMPGETQLTGRELEDLPRGRFYAHDQVAELVTEVLPSLQDRIPLSIETEHLPTTTVHERPTIRLRVDREGDQLTVLPTLTYGDPPTARVDAGALVPLQGPIPMRNLEAERSEQRRLRDALGLGPGHKVSVGGEDAMALAEKLARWAGPIQGSAHRAFYHSGVLEPEFETTERGFDLHFLPAESASAGPSTHAEREGGRVAAATVLEAWKNGESMVPLAAGGFAALPVDWLARFGDRVADLMAARSATGDVATAALPALGRLCDELDKARPPALSGLAPLLDDFRGLPRASLPDDLRAELRDYQQVGVDWLCFLREAGLGALLADDMGLGKTLQTLCALRGRSLVVAPTSVLHSWLHELQQFRPKTRWSLYHGPDRALPTDPSIVLTSYAILRLDADALAGVDWDVVVLDEAQNIKNPESQVAQAAYRLPARFRVALTGTPVENRLEELWSQLHFLNPGVLGSRSDFRKRTARPMAQGDTHAGQRLRDRIRPFVLRRLKSEVAPELPPRTEVVLHVALSEDERGVYDAVRAATVERAVEQLEAGGGVMEALEALLRLRQAACHAALVPGQQAESSTKVDTLIDRLDQAAAEGHKALVFSQWTGLLDRIEPHLASASIEFARLDGSTRNRAEVIERFQDPAGPPVMLISLRAGGAGLNLTAADHVFLVDPWWNPAVEDQAADRAHRIGQTRPVVIHRLVALDTVEEQILVLHQRKRKLARMALEEAGASGGLTREDLLSLLRE